jgi:hypothetical protein
MLQMLRGKHSRNHLHPVEHQVLCTRKKCCWHNFNKGKLNVWILPAAVTAVFNEFLASSNTALLPLFVLFNIAWTLALDFRSWARNDSNTWKHTQHSRTFFCLIIY